MYEKIILPPKNEAVTALPFGGTRPDGERIAVNSRYFEKNGQPFIPVMGEFHFSRWNENEWETSLRKMQAGGIDIVATYIFWIHHEEEKGVWDFSGSRNLRKFIAICKKLNFPLLLRIGPWAHGECRNGGFPDWLQLDRTLVLRTNDPLYLAYVKTYYEKIAQQAQGYLWQENGPIIGIQLENEYVYHGAPNGEGGKLHMHALKNLAVEAGFTVPLYTATAWGGANIVENETLPVWGGYADAPWEQHIEEMPPSENFLLSHAMNDPTIGTDLKIRSESGFTYQINDYPYLTAELGGGMQVTQHRRVVVTPLDTQALALCKLGSGANLLGYYMYHGGTNPQGRLSTLQESKATGYPNDLPVKSYDFQAPIGESGELHESYHNLRRLHLLIQQWGDLLAPASATIPQDSAADAADLESLRISVRHHADRGAGFVFISNHLRKRTLAKHDPLQIALDLGKEVIELPTLSIQNDDMKILPYNLKLAHATLKSTNAQPLTAIGARTFFFTDEEPIYHFDRPDAKENIVTLSEQQALHAWKFADHLYITAAALFCGEDGIHIISKNPQETVLVYGETGQARTLEVSMGNAAASVNTACLSQTKECAEYALTLSYPKEEKVEDVILQLDYLGDRAELFCDGTLIGDWFTTGLPYRTALKRFGYPKSLTVKIFASEEGIYFDLPVEKGCILQSAAVQVSRERTLEL